MIENCNISRFSSVDKEFLLLEKINQPFHTYVSREIRIVKSNSESFLLLNLGEHSWKIIMSEKCSWKRRMEYRKRGLFKKEGSFVFELRENEW